MLKPLPKKKKIKIFFQKKDYSTPNYFDCLVFTEITRIIKKYVPRHQVKGSS